MRSNAEYYLDKVFPGMGFRVFYLTVLSAFLLIIYYYNGSTNTAPDWFIAQAIKLTGIQDINFQRHFWSDLSALVMLMIIPLIIIRLTEGWRPTDLGLGIRYAKREFLLVELLWLLMIPLIWYISSAPDFQRMYPRLQSADNNATLFLYFELAHLIKWVSWEFFFRGFMLFGFAKDMGNKAVLLSTIAFAIMHIGKPEIEALTSIISGFILCYIAIRSKSIWPGVLLHSQVAMTMNFFTSSWWH